MKASRTIYAVFAWLFVAGVLVQVFFAGMTVVARQWSWDNHAGLGHGLGLLLLVMVITMYVAKLPRQMKRLTWMLFGVYILQADVVIFLRDSVPVVSALHPVLALIDFALGFWLARRATELISDPAADQAADLESSTTEAQAGD